MPPSQFFVTCALSFMAGILLASFGLAPLNVVAGWGCGIGLVFVCTEIFQTPGKRRHRILVVATGLIFFCLGILRFSLAQRPSEFREVLNIKGEWEGLVVEDADIRILSRQLTVRLDGFRQNVLVVTDPDRNVTYGDRVWLTGTLTEPQPFSDFDYDEYLKRFNVYAVMRRPKISVLRRGQGNPAVAILFKSKNYLVNRINRYLKEPESSLLIGILIGARKTLSDDIVQEFNRTGLSHIVAVSGYNISIIIVSLGFLAQYAGRRASFFISGAIIVGFVVMTGGGASIMRAGIMGALLLVAGRIGRPYSVTPSLVVSAAIMCAINPRILFWDKGFQLSFAATAGIIYALPHMEVLLERVPDWLGLKSILLTTFSASLFTWPLLVEGFGRVSIVAPVANLAILPVVPWVMLTGFLVLIPGVGGGFAFLSHLLLEYILRVLGYLSNLPWASEQVDTSWVTFLAAVALSGAIYLLIWVLATRVLRKRQKARA